MLNRSFCWGVLMGAVLGLLLAPDSGKRTRQALRKRYFEIKDRVLEALSQIKDISRETYENVVDSVVNAYEETRQVTSGEAAQIRNELKDGYQRIRAALAAAPEK